MPSLCHLMNNFMDCAIMMYGSAGRYCVTYKTSERSYNIYKRKYIHDFKIKVIEENFEASKSLFLKATNQFLVCMKNHVRFYDAKEYTEMKDYNLTIAVKESCDIKIKN